jgi:hypothetical protein
MAHSLMAIRNHHIGMKIYKNIYKGFWLSDDILVSKTDSSFGTLVAALLYFLEDGYNMAEIHFLCFDWSLLPFFG